MSSAGFIRLQKLTCASLKLAIAVRSFRVRAEITPCEPRRSLASIIRFFTAVRLSTNCCGEEAKPPSELRIDSASSRVVCNCATLVSSPAHPGRDKVTELSSVRRCSNVCRVSAMGRSTDKSGADVSEYCRITSPMTFLRALVAKNQNFLSATSSTFLICGALTYCQLLPG